MLHVGIDARTLARANPRGIGRYVGHLVACGGEVAPDVSFHLFYDADQVDPDVPNRPGIFLRPVRCRGDRWRLWERVGLPWAVRRARMDVLHCPANVAPVWQPAPTVVTVHDTILWDNPEEGGLGPGYAAGPLTRALWRAHAIITISQASRRDIVARFPWAESRLHVIPHGIADAFCDPVAPDQRNAMRKSLGISGRYVLYVGGPGVRKRADWAVRLFARWREQAACDLRLVLLGFGDADPAEAFLAAPDPKVREGLHVLPVVPAVWLPALYAESDFVVFPSLREGFGFPCLEAQAVGRPVLVSDTSSLPEVSGPAARRLDPADFEAWVQAGRALLGEDRCPDSDASRRWARGFSWVQSARRTLEVYRRVAEKRR